MGDSTYLDFEKRGQSMRCDACSGVVFRVYLHAVLSLPHSLEYPLFIETTGNISYGAAATGKTLCVELLPVVLVCFKLLVRHDLALAAQEIGEAHPGLLQGIGAGELRGLELAGEALVVVLRGRGCGNRLHLPAEGVKARRLSQAV